MYKKFLSQFLLLAWLICDPNFDAIGCLFQIYQKDTLIFQTETQSDGSILWNVDDLSYGSHKIKIRYWCSELNQSEFTNFTIRKVQIPGISRPVYYGYEKGHINIRGH